MSECISSIDPALSRRTLIQALVGSAIAVPLAAGIGPAARAASVAPATSILPQPDSMLAGLTDGVWSNSNESPLGPCDAARALLERSNAVVGRYGMRFSKDLAGLFARQNGLDPDTVLIYPGSYIALRDAALAFAGEGSPLAYGAPTFDPGFYGPDGKGIRPLVRIEAGADHRIDVRALFAAAPNAGVYYICNPNNPTGLITSMKDIEWLLANKSSGSKVIVDEAYIHFSDAQSALPLVAEGADVVVLRTFSKIYGLAGLRVGLAAARKDLLASMQTYGPNIPSMPGVLAAIASLEDPGLVAERKRYNANVRDDLYAFLEDHGVEFLRSQACFTMVKVGRDGNAFAKAMAGEGVNISGSRDTMPDWVRVSFGTPEEMAQFKVAFLKTLSA